VIHRRKNGEEFPVLLSTSVVRDDVGAPIALVGISRDITEQKLLQQQLDEAQRQRSAGLRRFATSVQRAQEEERERISRELHDDLCQRLSGIKFRAEVLEDEVRPLNKRVSRQLREFKHELDRSITEVRRISSNLRPSVLDDFGLVIALKLLCKDFEKVHAIKMTFQLANPAPRYMDRNIEIALYRIAQEALSNIARHAAASSAALHLMPRGSTIQLIVEDDGKGFNQEDTARAKGSGHGLGLISMRERTELLGGSFDIDSACNKGTTIAVTIPTGEHTPHEEDKNPDR
jgi:signal transduction histidine kinase